MPKFLTGEQILKAFYKDKSYEKEKVFHYWKSLLEKRMCVYDEIRQYYSDTNGMVSEESLSEKAQSVLHFTWDLDDYDRYKRGDSDIKPKRKKRELLEQYKKFKQENADNIQQELEYRNQCTRLLLAPKNSKVKLLSKLVKLLLKKSRCKSLL